MTFNLSNMKLLSLQHELRVEEEEEEEKKKINAKRLKDGLCSSASMLNSGHVEIVFIGCFEAASDRWVDEDNWGGRIFSQGAVLAKAEVVSCTRN